MAFCSTLVAKNNTTGDNTAFKLVLLQDPVTQHSTKSVKTYKSKKRNKKTFIKKKLNIRRPNNMQID